MPLPESTSRELLVGVNLSGGLGNQMFQYAAGLAVAERLGANLACDCHFYKSPVEQRLGLEEFGITVRECRDPRPWGALRSIARAFGADRGNPLRQGVRFTEQFGYFNPDVLTLRAPCYLAGLFQSWRYFEGSGTSVRQAFDIGRIGTTRTAPMEAVIRAAANPVAVHIRRGDYTTPKNTQLYALLDADYYRRARQEIESRAERPTYFLFSDDLALGRAELGDWPGLVPTEGLSAHEDLRLMALCKHFIIANSTFSWWGAWLGAGASKVVVAPQRWFKPAQRQTFLPDLYPADWVVV